MKKFNEVLSKKSWLVFYIGFWPMWLILFRPSWLEFGVFYAVDFAALLLTLAFDRSFFLRLFPASKSFFPEPNDKAVTAFTVEQRLTLFNELMQFPRRRAQYCTTVSFLKMLPGLAVCVFYWEHEVTNLVQSTLVLGAALIIFAYFYGAIFIDSHLLASRKIAEFHNRDNWTEVFEKVSIRNVRNDFEIQERLVMLSIWTFMIVLQVLLAFTHDAGSTRSWLALEIGAVGFAGLLLVTRIWYLGRTFFTGGLGQIFEIFRSFDPTKIQNSLPLHSSGLLARFEIVVNSLMHRLRSYERELTQWIFRKTEESRYSALGEISAMIVHDLSAPIHTIRFCTKQIREKPELAKDERYLENLTINGDRSLELINSVRAYLKDTQMDELQSSYPDVHEHVIRLLKTQFSKSEFKKIEFSVDSRLQDIVFWIRRADLMHIVLNLFTNSVSNFVENKIESPKLRVELEGESNGQATIRIKDNGTGLTPERFERLTAFMFLPDQGPVDRKSLGLKLIRRLAERHGGSLTVEAAKQGTSFLLELRKDTTLEDPNFDGKTNQEHLDLRR